METARASISFACAVFVFENSARWRSGGHVLRAAALRLGLRAPATEHRSDRFHYWVAGFILGDDRDSTLPYVLRCRARSRADIAVNVLDRIVKPIGECRRDRR